MGGVAFACRSETGPVREHNEDNVCFLGMVLPAEHQSFGTFERAVGDGEPFAVGLFDGMGGESSGELASHAAAGALAAMSGGAWSAARAADALLELNRAVCAVKAELAASTMGTTATALFGTGGSVWVANLGDSPAYLVRGGDVSLLSEAHTDAALLEALGVRNRHPSLTQYLGVDEEEMALEPHVAQVCLTEGDWLVVASDGVSDVLAEQDVRDALGACPGVAEAADELVDRALARGARDNVTVIVGRVEP